MVKVLNFFCHRIQGHIYILSMDFRNNVFLKQQVSILANKRKDQIV